MQKKSNKLDKQQGLYPPVCLNAVNNTLDISLLSGYIITIRIPNYFNMIGGDSIVVSFGDIDSDPRIVSDDEYLSPVDVKFYSDMFYNGDYNIFYFAKDRIGNISTQSPVTTIKIINAKPRILPAPQFPESKNEIIYYDDVINNQGTLIRASYDGMSSSDLVTLNWQGRDENDHPVDAATWSYPITVKELDVQDKYIQARIPAQKITVLGDHGIGSGSYILHPQSMGSQSYLSQEKRVTLLQSIPESLSLVTTTNAPPQSKITNPYINPCNRVAIFGQPYQDIMASVTLGATISETSSDYYLLRLNSLGQLSDTDKKTFSVYSEKAGNITVVIFPVLQPDKMITSNMSFLPYKIGTGDISLYGYTTGAPNDGKTPCSVYFIANRGVNFIYVSVDKHALINGISQQIAVPLKPDGTAEIDITNLYAEKVSISCSAQQNFINANVFYVDFINQPSPVIIDGSFTEFKMLHKSVNLL
ncbi:TPA: hypothetical protein PXM11_003775 [Yersinia enterocolitica]|uniref:hypothetical protein n=1 Tax=Yersinia enterocolitica TaxID=630 RepID=UPI0033054458|nr:hypothetical protein [Yersinia enterocolitica]HDL6972514.1 hypothetical protein [Yersinia enterocolitica]HDL6976667.1 hypothetical protein [Yersinia enterocolitica]HDL6989022.1 hypothetical protein [Yersinia enterocolitica]HDL6997684.1 hypothetical protein [Yersinia enterocolitica]